MAFNLWIGPSSIFDLLVHFKFFSDRFPITVLGLDLCLGAHVDRLLLL
jgi:hypothetical protein